jgi:hypothetical protein
MSEAMFKIGLVELKKVRLVCRQCGTAVEYPVEKVERMGDKRSCPGCNNDLRGSGKDQDDPLSRLGAALRELKADRRLEVELVLPLPTGAADPFARRGGA